ncbi:MAG: hypothetical protein K8S27_01250 [Candidatus Omnitrophica bacterium]|nr:hypothetical protein [Candidatus Omnitrophota bacterium]
MNNVSGKKGDYVMHHDIKNVFFLVVIGLLYTGCAHVSHMDELLVLKGLADEQSDLQDYIDEEDDSFYAIKEAIDDKEVNRLKNQGEWVRLFGDPLFKDEVIEEGELLVRWLYRPASAMLDSDKVYVYFSQQGQIIKWDFIPQE